MACFSFSLKRSWRFSQFCWRCDTSKRPGDPYSFWDLNDRPEWEQTLLSHGQFLARMIPPETARLSFDLGKFFVWGYGGVWGGH